MPEALCNDMLDLVERCEAALFAWGAVRSFKTWSAQALTHLAGAADYLRDMAERPQIFGDVGCLVQAAWLLGKAEAVAHEDRWQNRNRRRPLSTDPRVKAARQREFLRNNPGATAAEIAKATGEDDVSNVRRNLKRGRK